MDDQAVNESCQGVDLESIGTPPLQDPLERNIRWDEEGKNRADFSAFTTRIDQVIHDTLKI